MTENKSDPSSFNHPTRGERAAGVVVLLLLVLGSLTVLSPFLWALIWAIILSFALWPVHRRVIVWLGGRRTLAALLVSLAIAAALVVPLIVTVVNLADDAQALVDAGHEWIRADLHPAPPWVGKMPVIGQRAVVYWNELAQELAALTREGGPTTEPTAAPSTAPTAAPTTAPTDHPKLQQALHTLVLWTEGWLVTLGLAIGGGTLQIVLSLFLMFFFLKDGEALALRLRSMTLQISGERGGQLLDVAGGTVRGVIYGILGTAVVQGLLAGIGFLIAGVPGATLLGLLTFVASPLPIGPPMIWIPASIWLFHRGFFGWGVFMIVWGIGVSSIDNVVKPWLISRGAKMPFILIFFGVLGGAIAFGLVGVFIGPTILAVVYRLVDEWSRPETAKPAVVPTVTESPKI